MLQFYFMLHLLQICTGPPCSHRFLRLMTPLLHTASTSVFLIYQYPGFVMQHNNLHRSTSSSSDVVEQFFILFSKTPFHYGAVDLTRKPPQEGEIEANRWQALREANLSRSHREADTRHHFSFSTMRGKTSIYSILRFRSPW